MEKITKSHGISKVQRVQTLYYIVRPFLLSRKKDQLLNIIFFGIGIFSLPPLQVVKNNK